MKHRFRFLALWLVCLWATGLSAQTWTACAPAEGTFYLYNVGNAGFLQLMRNLSDGEKICYYLGEKECDFVIQTGIAVKELVQVCWDMKDKETRDRELEGIREAAAQTGCHQMTIVTRELEEEIHNPLGTIRIVPAWKWF